MKDVEIFDGFLYPVLFHIRKSCVYVCGGVCMAAQSMFIERSAVHPLLPGHTNTLWSTVSSILSADVALHFEASSLGAILSLGNVSSLQQPWAQAYRSLVKGLTSAKSLS